MSDDNESIYAIIDRLDDRRARIVRDKIKEIDFRKQDYERVYHIQFNEYRLHNSLFRHKPAKAIEPEDYSRMLDAELIATAKELEREQLEERREKEAERQQEQEPEPTASNDNDKPQEEEKDIDPRRLAFRQRMKEMDEERDRHRGQDKGYD